MCPVAVANEVSGLKGKARMVHSQRRTVGVHVYPARALERAMKISEVITRAISGKDQLDPGGRDSGNVGQAVTTVAQAMGQIRLRRDGGCHNVVSGLNSSLCLKSNMKHRVELMERLFHAASDFRPAAVF